MSVKLSREELIEKIHEFKLFDDTYMTAFFNGQPELIELVLRIILNKSDLRVTGSQVQKTMKNIRGHSSILDIYAVDGDSTVYNIEVQCRSDGASPRRARYYSSLLDSNCLPEQEDYDDLPETYVIFLTAKDVFGKGLPVYTVDRTVSELGHISFNDHEHIIYVNGECTDDTPLGRLVHDFKCPKPSEMYYKPLADRAHDLKDTEGGNTDMCQIMEEIKTIAEKERSRKVTINLLTKTNIPLEEIADYSMLPLEEVKEIAAGLREREK